MSFYEILGVTTESTKDQIKKAYRELSKIYHPDVIETGDVAKFREISDAYETLTDEDKRKEYDSSLGKAAFDPNRNTDIYSQVFDSEVQRTKQIKGDDVRVEIEISMEESLSGLEKTITLTRKKPCKECNSKGKILVATAGCERCGGSRVIIKTSTNPQGIVTPSRFKCPDCKDVKDTYETCTECEGKGTLISKLKVPIVIVAGIVNGTELKIPGHGKPGQNGGDYGDLRVKVKVKDDGKFKIEDGRLTIELPTKFRQFVLGDAVQIDVYGKKVFCLIPKGANPGDKVLVRNTGYVIGNSATDAVLEVTLKLEVPTEVNSEVANLLKQLDL